MNSTDSSRVNEIRERLTKAPERPWFVGHDDAEECGPHKNSGLALVDTGRESDWPIARLCEWPTAEFIKNAPDDIKFLLNLLATHLSVELVRYLDSIVIDSNSIGDIRRSCFMPWDSSWNGLVRDETAAREVSPDALASTPSA